MNLKTRENTLNEITEDLLSIPPFIGKTIRNKIVHSAVSEAHQYIVPYHFAIMKLLERAGALHVSEIGNRLNLPRPQMTHLIDKLVKLNLVERQTDLADRRALNIKLTSKGKAVVKEHEKLIKNTMKLTFSHLTDEEVIELSSSLKKLRDILIKL